MLVVGERTKFTRESILKRLKAVIKSGKTDPRSRFERRHSGQGGRHGRSGPHHRYSTGRSRIRGLPTTPIGHSNPATMDMYDEISNVVDDTPIIGGAEATDPV